MPMPAAQIEALIKAALPDAHVKLKRWSTITIIFLRACLPRNFEGKSRVAQHKMVYAALGGRMGGELHALQLSTSVPT